MEKKDDPNWNTLASTQEGEKYKATLTGLESGTAYTYRLVYNKESDQYASDEVMFTTESTTPLPYGNMDTWNKSDKTWYLGAVRSFGIQVIREQLLVRVH